jgi:hypothetical protein
VEDVADSDAEVGLDQPASGEDVLDAPGELLVVVPVRAFEPSSVAPR